MSTETNDFSRSNFVYRKQQIMAWLGIEPVDSEGYLDIKQSLSVLHPSLVERNLKIADLANDINLHAEIEPGECCCGLALEYAGMPLQSQIGHTFRTQATSVIMLDTADGIKLHCQICNEYWPAFTSECVHHKTHEPVYCHNCLQDFVRAVQNQGCAGHASLESPSALEESNFKDSAREFGTVMIKKAEPGGWIASLVAVMSLVLNTTNFAKPNEVISVLLDEIWLTLGLIALMIWLYAIYRDSDKRRSARIKARAVGVAIWAASFLIATELLGKVLSVITYIMSGMGIS